MMKNIKNEWYKIYKGKRLAIFLMILFATSLGLGFVVRSLQMSGTLDVSESIGGNFALEVLGMLADIVLPVFTTLFVTFLVTDEINSGSLKLPLLCGQSRDNLIASKAVVVIMGLFSLMAVTFITSNVVAVFFWGSDSVISDLSRNAVVFVETFLALTGWALIILFVSLFMKNSGAMVGVATIVLVVGTVVSSVCPQFAKYEVMYYFKAFISLQPMNHLFAFSICAGTIVVFFILTTVKFRMLQIQK